MSPHLLLAVLREIVEHVAHHLAPEDADALRIQVAPNRTLRLPPREARYPIVRSTALYPVPDHTPLKTAVLAYQEGISVVLHCTWHWDGEGDDETMRHLLTRHWPGAALLPSHDCGESLLCTAVPAEGKACEFSQARSLLAHLQPPDATAIPVQPLALDGATLYVQQWLLPQQTSWPALLFHDCATEASPAADHLATVDWPLLALYHMQRELANLLQRLTPLPLVAAPGTHTPVATTDRLQATLAGLAQHALRQIEADIAQIIHQAEQRTAGAGNPAGA